MDKVKIIGIFGQEQTDLCIYLASILENMKYHVLVIDNSNEQKMNCCIPKPNAQLHITTYKGIDYQNKTAYVDIQKSNYDFILVDLGKEPFAEELSQCEELILVVGCEYPAIQTYNAFMKKAKIPMTVVLRNYQKETMLKKRLKKQLEEENCFLMELHLLPFDAWDESKRIMMQYEGYQDCNGLSKEYEKLLLHLTTVFTNQGYYAARRGLIRAKKGVCY